MEKGMMRMGGQESHRSWRRVVCSPAFSMFCVCSAPVQYDTIPGGRQRASRSAPGLLAQIPTIHLPTMHFAEATTPPAHGRRPSWTDFNNNNNDQGPLGTEGGQLTPPAELADKLSGYAFLPFNPFGASPRRKSEAEFASAFNIVGFFPLSFFHTHSIRSGSGLTYLSFLHLRISKLSR